MKSYRVEKEQEQNKRRLKLNKTLTESWNVKNVSFGTKNWKSNVKRSSVIEYQLND